jgi:predicted RecB family nuclease
VTLKVGNLEAEIDALVPAKDGVSPHEPYLVIGTHAVCDDQKIRLAAIGYIIEKFLHFPVTTGVIVNSAGNVARIKLTKFTSTIEPIIETLKIWTKALPSPPPPIMINNHCQVCSFRQACHEQAVTEDNLSLLDRMTPKVLNKLKIKGILTINQLSYLHRPRRNRIKRKHIPIGFNLALQALALRTQKIYVQEPPFIAAQATEIFVDFESVPGQGFDYLIGIIICHHKQVTHHSLWADTMADEANIFKSFLRIVEEHPNAPIYHYGSYEPKCLSRIAKKYGLAFDAVHRRLVNINAVIFGKVYFPTRSNTLKDLGKVVGAK